MRTGSHPYRHRPSQRRLFQSQDALGAGAPGDLRGLHAAMRRYLEYLGVKGYTEQGRYNAERQIRDFTVWADERGVTHPQQVSRQVLERYRRWLHHYRKKNGEPLHLRSQRTKLIPLKGFFKWLTKTGEIPANPAADLELPREPHRLPQAVLTVEEVERILALADLGSPIGLRDRAMLEVLYASGIRRMEIAHLRIDDVDLQRQVLMVRQGKGQKDRLVPLGERAAHWVQLYLEQARPQLAWNQDPTLFLGNEGNPLHPMWLSTVISGYVQRSGVGKKGSCHLFRHTMATLMLEGGADIRHIQAMLGHADISSTQLYTQVAIRHLQQVHARTHPGVQRRQRGQEGPQDVQTKPDMPAPHPEVETSAEALLETLSEEAREEKRALQADAPPAARG